MSTEEQNIIDAIRVAIESMEKEWEIATGYRDVELTLAMKTLKKYQYFLIELLKQ